MVGIFEERCMKKFYNSSLAVVLLLCGLMAGLTACSRDGGEDMPERPSNEETSPDASNPGEVQRNSDSIIATISQATGARDGQDVNGLKVGDSIYYNLTIDDSKSPKSATYSLDLDGVGSIKNHRRFNQDFTLRVAKIADDGSTNDWQKITEFPYTLPSKGRYRLMYVAKSDGTFIHEFKLQRQVDKKPNSKVTNFTVAFNVLSVDFVYTFRTLPFGKVIYFFGVKIKCGNFTTDKLFEQSNSRFYSYKIVYDGKEYNNSFKPGTVNMFMNSGLVNYKPFIGPYVENKTITELIIEVKDSESTTPTYFQYKNLKMQRDDSWIK